MKFMKKKKKNDENADDFLGNEGAAEICESLMNNTTLTELKMSG